MKIGDLVRLRIDYIHPYDWDRLAHKLGVVVHIESHGEEENPLHRQIFHIAFPDMTAHAFENEMEVLSEAG